MNGVNLLQDHYNRVRKLEYSPIVAYISSDIVEDAFKNYFLGNFKPDLKDGDNLLLLGIFCIIKIPFPPYTIVSFTHEN